MNELQAYQQQLRKRLKRLAPVFAKAAVGDFSGRVTITEPEDELTELFVGVQIMLDTIREKVAELEESVHELQTANDVIASQKAKAEAILDSLGEGVITVDSQGHTTYANEPAITLLGARARTLGRDVTQVIALQSADGQPVKAADHPVRVAIRTKERVAFGITSGSAYFLQNFPAELRRVGMTITPVVQGGKLAEIAVVVRDITDESNMDRTKTEIVSIASHQLRTPLTAVRWYVKTLLDPGLKLSAEQRAGYLGQIHNSCKRMVQLVEALLNVSRIDLGTLQLKPRPTDLTAVLNTILQDLDVGLQAKHLKLQTKLDRHLAPLMIDPEALRIILQNLLSNAVQYSLPGKTILLTVEQHQDGTLISVQDHGIGIPRAEQAKLFTKLFRASNAKAVEPGGSGLGLYIVKAMVERAGGLVWFESTEKRGTTFYATIPSKEP